MLIRGINNLNRRLLRKNGRSMIPSAACSGMNTVHTTSGRQNPNILSAIQANSNNFHSTSEAKNNATNLSRDTRMAGRRRFYKTVDVKPIPPPWSEFEDNGDTSSKVDNPISAGVDGTNSATNISLDKPTKSSMKTHLITSSQSTVWYGITLDGRLMKTPLGTTLSVPSLPLALAIAAEWDDQNLTIKPAQMPLMTLCCTTMDQFTIPAVRYHLIDDLLRYLQNDTTCYWADATEDRILHRRQVKHWEILHEWVTCKVRGLGGKPAIATGAGEGLIMSRIRKTKKVAGLPHSEEFVANARKFLESCDAWTLAAMQAVTMEAKSFLVGMAVVRSVDGWVDAVKESESFSGAADGKKNPFSHDVKKAIMASRVEEEFQIDNWGLVEGGHDYDRLNCSIQIHAATSLLQSIAFTNALAKP